MRIRKANNDDLSQLTKLIIEFKEYLTDFKPDNFKIFYMKRKSLDLIKKSVKEEIADLEKKENIEQLNSIASLLPGIEVVSFKEIKGIYDISGRHSGFEQIYENTKECIKDLLK